MHEGATPEVDLSTYIEARRKHLGLTKVDAADIAGVSRRTWNEVEAGARAHPSPATLARMDRALGIREGTLYALSSRSRFDRIEQLRRAAAYLFRTMSTTDFAELLETHPNVHETIEALVAEAERVRRELDNGRGEPGAGTNSGASSR